MTALLYLSRWCLFCLLFPLSTVFSHSWCSLHFLSFCRVWHPPVYHPDLFPFGNSGWSTPCHLTDPLLGQTGQTRQTLHSVSLLLLPFVFARSFSAFFRCWLGVGFGILCWSMWLHLVFSFVSGLRCGSFRTLIIWLGWVGLRYWTTISGTTILNQYYYIQMSLFLLCCPNFKDPGQDSWVAKAFESGWYGFATKK